MTPVRVDHVEVTSTSARPTHPPSGPISLARACKPSLTTRLNAIAVEHRQPSDHPEHITQSFFASSFFESPLTSLGID